ncbi:MAG: hypothetical protein JXA24_01490 [Proteobacteria bacterium]|nr:hypothetical protein [Pseudomonadota bacterium]
MARKELIESTDVKFDLRLIDMELRDGRVKRKDYEDHLKSLPDDEARGELVEVYQEPAQDAAADESLTFTSG